MPSQNIAAPAGKNIDRGVFLKLILTAFDLGHQRFAREAALAWLSAYPGDLPINLVYAKILLKDGHPDLALRILQRLCLTDPEYLEAYNTRLEAELNLQKTEKTMQKGVGFRPNPGGTVSPADTLACIYALDEDKIWPSRSVTKGSPEREPDLIPEWSQRVYAARQAFILKQNREPSSSPELDHAEEQIHLALVNGGSNLLVAVTHLRLLASKGADAHSLVRLAETYQQRWPECLQFTLFLADALMKLGETEKAVALLHRSASNDVSGQVATRLWGDHHPYRALWPGQLTISMEIAIPAAVAAALGWNQLPARVEAPSWRRESLGEPVALHSKDPFAAIPTHQQRPSSSLPHIPEALLSIQNELERVANHLKQPTLARSDGRFPVYVVVTTRQGLERQYGSIGADLIEQQMKKLVSAVQMRRDWHALLFYADHNLPPGITPARYNDPWSIKLALADLDVYLAHKGEMIGAVLIVGGPEVVPFHHLPNPVDDLDTDVPSDNPYGSRDENYFIPEWPVGRLPAGASKDPTELLHALSELTLRHQEVTRKKPSASRWPQRWLWRISRLLHGPARLNHPLWKRPSYGHTAAVWRMASRVVFRPIGNPKTMRVSPPVDAILQEPEPLPPARLAYFNLHGVIDAVEWFGQSDPTELGMSILSTEESNSGSNDIYPVALRPQDIQNSGHAPEVVFSEACYGTHIFGKTVEQALALKFLQAGSQAVVGSTCIAYGSVNLPLIAADFLGHAFWNHLKQGYPAGEALRRAKIDLAREMHTRQGYLDGEDQKTLISFVLYGDPLAQPVRSGRKSGSIQRLQTPLTGIRTVCDRAWEGQINQPIPAEVLSHAKQIVAQYLPGMEDAEMILCQEHTKCDHAGRCCPTSQIKMKTGAAAQGEPEPKRQVVVLSKQIPAARHVHLHYARITLDEHNHLVKLVVSR